MKFKLKFGNDSASLDERPAYILAGTRSFVLRSCKVASLQETVHVRIILVESILEFVNCAMNRTQQSALSRGTIRRSLILLKRHCAAHPSQFRDSARQVTEVWSKTRHPELEFKLVESQQLVRKWLRSQIVSQLCDLHWQMIVNKTKVLHASSQIDPICPEKTEQTKSKCRCSTFLARTDFCSSPWNFGKASHQGTRIAPGVAGTGPLDVTRNSSCSFPKRKPQRFSKEMLPHLTRYVDASPMMLSPSVNLASERVT